MWQNIFKDVQSKLNEPSAIISFAPAWMVSGLLLVGALAVAWIIHAIVLASLRRIFGERRPYLSRAIAATKNPTRLALLLAALAIALSAAPLGADTRLILVRCLMLATICLIGWIALIVLHIAADFYLAGTFASMPKTICWRASTSLKCACWCACSIRSSFC
jgi:uncharacterized membrane protein